MVFVAKAKRQLQKCPTSKSEKARQWAEAKFSRKTAK